MKSRTLLNQNFWSEIKKIVAKIILNKIVCKGQRYFSGEVIFWVTEIFGYLRFRLMLIVAKKTSPIILLIW